METFSELGNAKKWGEVWGEGNNHEPSMKCNLDVSIYK